MEHLRLLFLLVQQQYAEKGAFADLHAGQGNTFAVYWHLSSIIVFLSFSGVCICGSDGHGVVGMLAGEIRQLVGSFAVWPRAASGSSQRMK